MEPGEGYKEAGYLLHRKSGDQELIVTAYVDKILVWPRLRDDDVEEGDQFYITYRVS